MLGDPWPEEPDDPFPVDDVEAPSTDIPDAPDASDAPQELVRGFWGLVAVFNVGLFALAFGAMLIAFRARWAVGGAIAAVGAVALAYGAHRYHVYRDRLAE